MTIRRQARAGSALLAIAIALSAAGCNKAQEPAATSSAAASVGAEIDDGLLSARVAAALLAGLSSRSYGFKVEAHQGQIQLSGHGQSEADVERAVAVVRAVPGVKSVDNKASVKAVDTTVGNAIDDGIITARVKTTLLADASVRGLKIGVETQKGEVRLSGTVDTAQQKELATQLARGIDGVRSVSNQLSVRQ
jgi:hyperosmotically inducible protein